MGCVIVAGIFQDYLECPCGHSTFREERICQIKMEASKAQRIETEPYSDRFLENKQVRYVCCNCGKTLNA